MKKKKLIIVSILVVLFCFITGLVIFNKTGFIDDFGYRTVRSLENSFFDKYFVGITKLGNEIVVIGIVLALVLLFRNRHSIMFVLLAANSAITNSLIKLVIKRSRPDVLNLIVQGGYSFPSGHSMIAVCVYGYLLYLAYTKINNKYLKYGLSILLGIVILSIGISRIYVGVHYTSDVLGGFILGLIELILLIDVSKKFSRGN